MSTWSLFSDGSGLSSRKAAGNSFCHEVGRGNSVGSEHATGDGQRFSDEAADGVTLTRGSREDGLGHHAAGCVRGSRREQQRGMLGKFSAGSIFVLVADVKPEVSLDNRRKEATGIR